MRQQVYRYSWVRVICRKKIEDAKEKRADSGKILGEARRENVMRHHRQRCLTKVYRPSFAFKERFCLSYPLKANFKKLLCPGRRGDCVERIEGGEKIGRLCKCKSEVANSMMPTSFVDLIEW